MTRTLAGPFPLQLFSLLVVATPVVGSDGSFKGLEGLPGGRALTSALAVSSDGSVVVGYSFSAGGNRAVRWDNGVIAVLPAMPNGALPRLAQGVSGHGSVVVGEAQTTSGSEAFVCKDGTAIDFNGLTGGRSCTAWGVSGDGRVTVGQMASGSGQEAFRWSGGKLIGLGDLAGGEFQSVAYGVSADGSVIVGSGQSAAGEEAVMWTNGVMRGLGRLPGGSSSLAMAVSADGKIVVGRGESVWGVEAFRWENGSMIGLGGLFAHHDLMSYARSVSADGSVVVGTSEDEAGGLSAFIWDADHGMRSLQEVLAGDLGVDLTGWKLAEATGVSSDGLTIVGNGVNPHGDTQAWVARLDAATTRPAESSPCHVANGSSKSPETGCRFGKFERMIGSIEAPAGIALDAEGALFVCDPAAGVVRVYDSRGDQVRQWSPGGNPRANQSRPQGIALGEGNLYITDTASQRIVVCDKNGRQLRGWGEPGEGPSQFREVQGIAADAHSVYVADTGNHRIQVFDHQGRFVRMFGGFGHDRGQFSHPSDVAVAADGSIFVADTDNHRIQKFDAEGRFVLAWGEWGHARGLFSYPSGVACQSGAVYVTDTANHRVQVFDEQGAVRYAWGMPAVVPHEAGGRFHYPTRLALSPAGDRAVVSEPREGRVQTFRAYRPALAEGGTRAGFASSASYAHFGMYLAAGNDQLAISQPDDHTIQLIDLRSKGGLVTTSFGGYGGQFGQLNDPAGLSFNPGGHELYVNDRGNQRIAIYEISHEGDSQPRPSTIRSRLVRTFDYQTLTSLVPALRGHGQIAPEALKCGVNRIYLVDPAHGRVFVFSSNLQYLHALGDGGAAAGELERPVDVAEGRESHVVFVVDAEQRRIQAFDSNGRFLFGWGGRGAGPGEFEQPCGITAATEGSIYVTDSVLHRVQEFDEKGRFKRQWGGRGIGPGEMFKPAGIVEDGQKRLLVLDYGNHRVQAFSPQGECLAVFGGGIYAKPAGPLVRPLLTPAVVPVSQPAPANAKASDPRGRQSNLLSATSNARTYTVSCTPSPAPIPLDESFDVDVRISRHDDPSRAVGDVSLSVDARMPAHGHGMNVRPRVEKKGGGRFIVSGLLFHMPGHWELYFDVTEGAATERAQIDVDLE